jgi:polar amino acid transport system substrate-binding protein
MREAAASAIILRAIRLTIYTLFIAMALSLHTGLAGASEPGPTDVEAPASDTQAPESQVPEMDLGERPVIRLSTLHWPPYTGDDLPEGGAASSVVRAAFAAQGYEIDVRFWPWNRAIAKARYGDERIAAYFPGYHCRHDPQGDFLRSDAIGATPLGFAEHKDAPQSWETLSDLSDKRIGTVLGYAHTEDFDRRVETGDQRVITSSDDIANLLKLADRQIHFAAIDRFVMAYVMATDQALEPHRDALRFHERPLGETPLYLCFRNDEAGQTLREAFNLGLTTINAETLLLDYVERLVKP